MDKNFSDDNYEKDTDNYMNKYFNGLLGVLCIVGLGYALLTSGHKKPVKNREIIKSYQWAEKDLNGDGIKEKFYNIDGEKYFYEIDGKN